MICLTYSFSCLNCLLFSKYCKINGWLVPINNKNALYIAFETLYSTSIGTDIISTYVILIHHILHLRQHCVFGYLLHTSIEIETYKGQNKKYILQQPIQYFIILAFHTGCVHKLKLKYRIQKIFKKTFTLNRAIV